MEQSRRRRPSDGAEPGRAREGSAASGRCSAQPGPELDDRFRRRASKAGMAISIPLDAQARQGVRRADRGRRHAAATGDAERPGRPAAAAHRYTARARPRAAGLADQQHRRGGVGGLGGRARPRRRCSSPSSSSPLPGSGRRSTRRARSTARRAAEAASIALGLPEANALDRAANAGLAETERAHATNQALWPGTAVYTLESPLGFDGSSAVRGRRPRVAARLVLRLRPRRRAAAGPAGRGATLRPAAGHRDAVRRRFLAARHTARVAREDGGRAARHLDGLARHRADPVARLGRNGAVRRRRARRPSPWPPCSVPSPTRAGCGCAPRPTSSLQLPDEWSTKLNDFSHLARTRCPSPTGSSSGDKYAERGVRPSSAATASSPRSPRSAACAPTTRTNRTPGRVRRRPTPTSR